MPHLEHETPSVADLIAQSYAFEQSGKISKALSRAKQALKQARNSGETEATAAALACVALCQYRLGHFGQANALAAEALNNTHPDSSTGAEALRILGNCAHEAGDLAAAEDFFHRAIDIARAQGDPRMLQSCLHSLSACVYFPRGQFELCLAADEEALRLALEFDLHELAWFSLEMTGWIYWVKGQRGRALAAAEKMKDFVQPGSMAEGYYLCLYGDLATDGENPGSAGEYFRRARSIGEVIGDPGLNAEARLGLSRWYRQTGDASAARLWAEDALGIAQRAGSADLQGWAFIERARANWIIGSLSEAEADLKDAAAVLAPTQANYDLARISFLLAALYHQQGRPEADRAWLEAVNRMISGGYSFLLERERSLAFPLLVHHLSSSDPQAAAQAERLLESLAAVPPPPLFISTLGKFEVRLGAYVIADQAWRQRKAGELFRLLLISPRCCAPREQVLHSLWPDKPASSAPALFHQATSSLRKALEPDLPDKFPSRYLFVDRGEICLRLPEGSYLDFEDFLQQVAAKNWESALEIYQGDLFPGDLYSDWSVEKREGLRYKAIRAALAAAGQALQAGSAAKALDACQRVLAMEPWQEEAVLLGMQACMAQNDRSGAIRLYKKLERTLKEELDIAPQEAVQRYYQTLLST